MILPVTLAFLCFQILSGQYFESTNPNQTSQLYHDQRVDEKTTLFMNNHLSSYDFINKNNNDSLELMQLRSLESSNSNHRSALENQAPGNVHSGNHAVLKLHHIQEVLRQRLTKDKSECRWSAVREAIDAFQDDSAMKLSNAGHNSHNHPILIQTSCLSTNSLGNGISEYIEARLCAQLVGLHYVDVFHTFGFNTTEEEGWFFYNLPSVVIHPFPKLINESKANIRKVCECPSICHEWGYGLMHKHMHLAQSIFRGAVDMYWNRYSHIKTSLNVKEKSVIVVQNPDPNQALPFIPDTAIHYRCGDNLVTHYGFLKFHVFNKVIPVNTRHIYVMAEIPTRNPKFNSQRRCSAIFEALKNYLIKSFPKVAIVIMRGKIPTIGCFYNVSMKLCFRE